MVNSKKMSKSSVAVIVLAILLVLSMVLGLTGAWFTDKDATQGTEGGSVTIRDGWLNLVVSGSAGAAVTSTGDLANAMPGDIITAPDATFSVSVSRVGTYKGAVKAYVFLVKASDNSKVECVPVEIEANKDTADVAFTQLDNEITISGDSILDDIGNGQYKVKESLTYDTDKGKTATLVGLGAYTIVAVQDENVTDENAAWTIAQTQLA